ncbi:protein of unknown function [Hyphomicrobium sp. 1Nfss2.1]
MGRTANECGPSKLSTMKPAPPGGIRQPQHINRGAMPIKRPPQSGPQRLRATASPVNTMMRPEAPLLEPDSAQPTELLQLAYSLRDLFPRLAQLGDSYVQTMADEGEAEALGLRLKTETCELTARIERSDVPPDANRAALELGHGEDLARQEFEQDIYRRYLGENTDYSVDERGNAFDRERGDSDAWLAGAIAEKEQAAPKTAAALLGYRRRWTVTASASSKSRQHLSVSARRKRTSTSPIRTSTAPQSAPSQRVSATSKRSTQTCGTPSRRHASSTF